MSRTLDIGTNLETAAPETVCLSIQGGTVTVKNVSGPTLNQHYDLHSTVPAFTTTAGNSQTHTTSGPVFLKPTGRTTITLTGAGY